MTLCGAMSNMSLGFVWQKRWRAHMRENASLIFLKRWHEKTDNSGWRLKDFTVWLRWIHYFILTVQSITFKDKTKSAWHNWRIRSWADWCTTALQGSWPASRWPQAKGLQLLKTKKKPRQHQLLISAVLTLEGAALQISPPLKPMTWL